MHHDAATRAIVTPARCFVCRCEDVTLGELDHTLARGLTTVEEIKRYTGLGTGPCQGKECQALCVHLLDRARREDPRVAAVYKDRPLEAPEPAPFTARPPVFPVSLGALAASRGGRR
mgnify:CR=1 FL=1